jgi:hypothetical protein
MPRDSSQLAAYGLRPRPRRRAQRASAVGQSAPRNSSGKTRACLRKLRSVPIAITRCIGTTQPIAPSNVVFFINDVTSTLTRPNEPEALQRLDRLLAGDPSEFRH